MENKTEKPRPEDWAHYESGKESVRINEGRMKFERPYIKSWCKSAEKKDYNEDGKCMAIFDTQIKSCVRRRPSVTGIMCAFFQRQTGRCLSNE
jgi:hypothetical protein